MSRRLQRGLRLGRSAILSPLAIVKLQTQVGALQSQAVAALGADEISKAEFSVFSQYGEDGIIQFLVQRVDVANPIFVEFGVGDYSEANTRFLLMNDVWRGLIIDGGSAHKRFLSAMEFDWRTSVEAVTAFIDRDNINSLIGGAGINGDIGLLSVDLDGNDYWVLEAVRTVQPRILVAEYNSIFGAELAVTTPYDATFSREQAHFSSLYWGASLAALTRAADAKGLALVGGNRAGNNAFFVRRDLLGDIPERTPSECWRPAWYRDSRGSDGTLTFLSDDPTKLRLLKDQQVVDLDRDGEPRSIGDVYAV